MDYVESAHIKNLRVLLDQQMADSEEANTYTLLDDEFPKVQDVIETHKRIKQSQQSSMIDNASKSGDNRSKADLDKYNDVIKEYCRVEQTRAGHIIDAQDYLGSWYLAIIVEEWSNSHRSERQIHFLPFANQKRDERFSDEDSNKIAPAFNNTGLPADPEKDLNQLRQYYASWVANRKPDDKQATPK